MFFPAILFCMNAAVMAADEGASSKVALRGRNAATLDTTTALAAPLPAVAKLQKSLRAGGFSSGGAINADLPIDVAHAVSTIMDYPGVVESSLTSVALARFRDAWGAGSFSGGLWQSFGVILVSEIGDETFIIAALMAMRHPRLIVFAGAIGALALMTIFSTAMGVVAPLLISRQTTQRFATVLYTLFGLRLLYISYCSKGGEVQEEMDECKEKLAEAQDVEEKNMLMRFFNRLCTPVFVQALLLTFLAEWGDRSQIATIALATHANPLGVTVGAIAGHSICTGIAVMAGRWVATKVTQRTVAAIGGTLFLFFAVHAALVPPDMAE